MPLAPRITIDKRGKATVEQVTDAEILAMGKRQVYLSVDRWQIGVGESVLIGVELMSLPLSDDTQVFIPESASGHLIVEGEEPIPFQLDDGLGEVELTIHAPGDYTIQGGSHGGNSVTVRVN